MLGKLGLGQEQDGTPGLPCGSSTAILGAPAGSYAGSRMAGPETSQHSYGMLDISNGLSR